VGLAEDISDLLTTGGFSSTVHIGDLFARPNSALGVVQTAGLSTIRAMGRAELEQTQVQLRARAKSYQDASTMMSSAHGILDGMNERLVNFRSYKWIEAIQTPFYIGQDEEDRRIFSCNLKVIRSAST